MGNKRHRINYPRLAYTIGALLLLESLFMLAPMCVGLFYGESDWRIFALSAGITALFGFIFTHIRGTSTKMGKREGFLLTTLVWIVFSIFGMIPFIAGTPRADVSSAFFEAISAFTTTGATAIGGDNSHFSHAIIFWQAMMQWLGGMGIILFTLAIIPALNTSGGMQMFNAETTGITHDKLMPRISQTAKALYGIYLVLTIGAAVLLRLTPMDWFNAVCLAFGTMSTGGFSADASGAIFNSDYVMCIVGLFMLMGGINFAVIFRLVTGRWRQIRIDEVLRMYFIAIIGFSIFFIVAKFVATDDMTLRSLLIDPVFMVISCITSTGYLVPGFLIWQPYVLSLMVLMMISGGCAGSTSGGAKIDRMVYLGKFIKNELYHVLHPNSVVSVTVNGRVVSHELLSKVVAFLCLFIMVIVAGGTVLSFMGISPFEAYVSSLSCMCNTGFETSLTGYGTSFAAMPAAAKWVLASIMLTGRLEIYTILVLFTPNFWR